MGRLLIPSYPKIWSFSNKIPVNPFDGKPAVFQEKVDGSQFSFGLVNDTMFMRSKSQDILEGNVPQMFEKAVETVMTIPLHAKDTIFRCEYLNKPKHNVLAYDRTPDQYLVVFDVYTRDLDTGLWDYVTPNRARAYASLAGLEYVPTWEQQITAADDLLNMLDRTSFLGGQKVEGVVMKRYDLLIPQFQTPLFLKYVSERFKETHAQHYNTPKSGHDFGQALALAYATTARWDKAVQHLRERGELQNDPRDIGPLMKEIQVDTRDEIEEDAKQKLYDWWWKNFGSKIVSRGFPEWYKEKLLRDAFEIEAKRAEAVDDNCDACI